MNLKDLPEINFVDTDPDKIVASVISGYEALAGKTLAPADPVRIFLTSIALIIVQLLVLINSIGKQNLLRYAGDDILDHMGARVVTDRIGAKSAVSMQRFTLSTLRPESVPITQGTRVSPDGQLFYRTTKAASVPSGSLYIDVPVECMTAGEIGNGYLPGQINILVDPIQWVASVSNTTTSSGGADEEDDDTYRERIRLAPESFSVAGPEGAYEYFAKSADPNIIDVSVTSPTPLEVEIRPLMSGGAIPTQVVLDAVLAKCSGKTVRPLTDHVAVMVPEQVPYNLTYTYWIAKDDEPNAAAIQTAAKAAELEYLLWQRSKLGRGINTSELVYRLIKAGAKRVQVTSPVAYVPLTRSQVAKEGTVTGTFGGIDDA